VESNWVHSAIWPPIGLLCQPQVIMMMEKLVEKWLAGETKVLGENMPHCRFVHHKPHKPARMRTWATAVRSQQLTAWATAWPIHSPALINYKLDSADIFFSCAIIWHLSIYHYGSPYRTTWFFQRNLRLFNFHNEWLVKYAWLKQVPDDNSRAFYNN
jgi:hypothetical protein